MDDEVKMLRDKNKNNTEVILKMLDELMEAREERDKYKALYENGQKGYKDLLKLSASLERQNNELLEKRKECESDQKNISDLFKLSSPTDRDSYELEMIYSTPLDRRRLTEFLQNQITKLGKECQATRRQGPSFKYDAFSHIHHLLTEGYFDLVLVRSDIETNE
ncbi:hypothetical protein OMP38_14550 [Cohnella ginsengisoli]|uniref:Uncharacterized protein n=1 Tax=Cohnella ginsengisoli TaxID=425004 RepID=A0A9X4KGV1_9BACL|nr:hypothetical protein [Cohnella ginsengisoli]MDG0791937.1 hypothetical protein [Cohnella ginsengisoli]